MHPSKIQESSLCRLMSYSAAAGLGAFGFGQEAEGKVIVKVIDPPVTVDASSNTFDIDFDGDGFPDAAVIDNTTNSIQIRSFGFDENDPDIGGTWKTLNWTLSNGDDYYIFTFPAGFYIDPAKIDTVDANTANPGDGSILRGTSYNFGVLGINALGRGGYVGFEFEIGEDATIPDGPGFDRGESTTHYGWAQIDGSFNPRFATITKIAYETIPGKGILIPEPGSLALLAAGGGALALRGRRS